MWFQQGVTLIRNQPEQGRCDLQPPESQGCEEGAGSADSRIAHAVGPRQTAGPVRVESAKRQADSTAMSWSGERGSGHAE